MRAIVIDRAGGPEHLTLREVADPEPAAGEVLIEVAAAGVNHADLMQRQGRYPPPPGASPLLGLECSGTIAALGPQVSGWQVGDEVCALLAGGGYAERAVAPAGQLLPVPAGLPVVSAAALPEVACTVYSMLVRAGRLAAGETVLIHGGASGIGTFAIQLATRLGARVICTAGSPAKLARCAQLGAEVTIDYRTEDFADRVREATDGRGVDVVLDIVGAAYLPGNIGALATGGRLVIIATQGGRVGELDIGAMLAKRATVHAAGLRSRPLEQKARIVAEVTSGVLPLVAAGEIRPVIHTTMPLADAARAHRMIEASEHVGKVLLTTG